VRGDDHVSNTPKHVLLLEALGADVPRFAHVPLILGTDRKRLSKRHGATSVMEYARAGYLPGAMVNFLAMLGWSPGGDEELLPVDELSSRFALEDVGHSAGVFDQEKLAWMNRHYMKTAPPGRLAAESIRYFLKARFILQRTDEAMEYLASLLPMSVGSVDRLEEIPDRVRFIFAFDAAETLARPGVAAVLREAGARDVIAALAQEISGPILDKETFRAVAARVRERTGHKGKALFHPIRAALTGETAGPELDLAVPAIDRGAALPAAARVVGVTNCQERARAFAREIGVNPS